MSWISKEWLWNLGDEQLQWQQYDNRMKCAIWSFQKIPTNHSVRSLWSSRDTKEIWSKIWNTERDTLNGENLESLRKNLFDGKWSLNFLKYQNWDFWSFQVLEFLKFKNDAFCNLVSATFLVINSWLMSHRFLMHIFLIRINVNANKKIWVIIDMTHES